MVTQTNLIKGKQVLGLKVVTMEKGKIIDNVDEILYDSQENRLTAFVVDKGGWFAQAKVLLFEDILSIGKDAIIIQSDSVVRSASEVKPQITRILKGNTYLTHQKIMTEDGTELGQVSDIYFDIDTGEVIELEVSQGALKTVQSGKKRVNVSDITKIGQDVTIVTSYTKDRLEEQAAHQGVSGMVTDVKAKTPGLRDEAKENFQVLTDKAKQKAREVAQASKRSFAQIKEDPATQSRLNDFKAKAQAARDTATEKFQEVKTKVFQKTEEIKGNAKQTAKKHALGKYITRNILTPSDIVLARRGDMVTMLLIETAEQNGMLDELLASVQEAPVLSP